ncbi:hypothetical protein CW304_11805 [Bacillus sp. UFRGS-B20]|nr:hypothetical protein CW304_11805 [Bacillus sp. UFRGS-B20]
MPSSLTFTGHVLITNKLTIQFFLMRISPRLGLSVFSTYCQTQLFDVFFDHVEYCSFYFASRIIAISINISCFLILCSEKQKWYLVINNRPRPFQCRIVSYFHCSKILYDCHHDISSPRQWLIVFGLLFQLFRCSKIHRTKR